MNEREELEQFRTMFGRLQLGPSTLAGETSLFSTPEQHVVNADVSAPIPVPFDPTPRASVPRQPLAAPV